MKFIAREKELAALENEYRRDGGFVVIYGRRRVGKTTLIKEFLKGKTSFYYLATKEIESQCMKRFAGVIARTTGNQAIANASFGDWLDLFRLVADYRTAEKKVLVIDEFPYLVKTNEAFPSVVQYAWDEFLKDSNVMLILCGSLVSMMKKHALSNESPIYGRRTAQIRLMPLTFTDVYPHLDLPFSDAVEQFSVTGGIPKYFDFFTGRRPLFDEIGDEILSKNGFLYEEPQFLLENEVQSPNSYFSIIKAIADGNHRLGNIAGALGLESAALTPYLTTLSDLGFIEKQVPVTEKNPDKSRKGLYFISDNFIRFWFRYVYPFKGELELDNTRIVLDELGRDFISNYVALTYESICQNLFASFCASGKIDFVPSRIGSFWVNEYGDENTQIDVAAVDRLNRRLFVGECKYRQSAVDADVYFDLRTKVENSKELKRAFPDYSVVYGIFSKSGFRQRLLDLKAGNPDLILIDRDSVL